MIFFNISLPSNYERKTMKMKEGKKNITKARFIVGPTKSPLRTQCDLPLKHKMKEILMQAHVVLWSP